MLGLTGVLIALIVLTIMLAGVFFLRPSITAGATGKILAFMGLCVLPGLCIGTGMSFHMQRSEQTAYCVSCHSMETHGQSLYVLNTSYIPAQHFQNHLVPSDRACYTCHTDYTMYGPLKDKLKGLKYVYMEYVSTPPKTIHLEGTYNNLQCLQCHAGTRDFEANLNRMPPMGSLVSNQISCISSGCHDTIHNASEVAHLQMWVKGTPPPPLASASATPAPATAQPVTAAGRLKAPAGNSAVATAAAKGKSVFDSQGCAACHGAAGAGGTGPALTHTSSQYPPAQLTAVLKMPTAGMKAAGMVPLTVNAADMKVLVSYVSSLGGTPATSAATPPSPGSSSAKPAAAEPVTAAASKTPDGNSTSDATTARGKAIFDSQGCSGCHGETGGGGTGPALAHLSSQYSPAQVAAVRKGITGVLEGPTAGMKAAGMVPLILNAADMEALVSYVSSVRGASAAVAAPFPAPGSSSVAPVAAGPGAAGAPSKASAGRPAGNAAIAQGKAIYDSQGCAGCHGEAGVGGTGPALTHVSSQYPPAKLTAVLKSPTAGMKAAGMAPLTVNATDLASLASYVSSLGGTSTQPFAP
jgi:mono/diheme cytochrome c family protein